MTTLAVQIEALRRQIIESNGAELDLVRALGTVMFSADASLMRELDALDEASLRRRTDIANRLIGLAATMMALPAPTLRPPPIPVHPMPHGQVPLEQEPLRRIGA